MADFWYTMDYAGVAAILKSDEVHAALSEAAADKAAAANTLFNLQGHKGTGYQTKVKDLTYTAIGVVYPTGIAGVKDNEKYQTLNAVNH
jgi:hypothetical protein